MQQNGAQWWAVRYAVGRFGVLLLFNPPLDPFLNFGIQKLPPHRWLTAQHTPLLQVLNY